MKIQHNNCFQDTLLISNFDKQHGLVVVVVVVVGVVVVSCEYSSDSLRVCDKQTPYEAAGRWWLSSLHLKSITELH
jgi:hypothetical protein